MSQIQARKNHIFKTGSKNYKSTRYFKHHQLE